MRQPKQKRSAETLEKVIVAAEKILRARTALTIARIVEDSGVSVGGIYARFADKEDVFQELVSRFMRHTLDEFERLDWERWQALSLADAIDELVVINANIYHTHRGVLRAVLMRTRLSRDPNIVAALESYSQKVGSDLLNLLLMYADQIEHPDPEEAINVAIEAMTAMLRENVILTDRETLDTRAVQRVQSLLKRFLQPSLHLYGNTRG